MPRSAIARSRSTACSSTPRSPIPLTAGRSSETSSCASRAPGRTGRWKASSTPGCRGSDSGSVRSGSSARCREASTRRSPRRSSTVPSATGSPASSSTTGSCAPARSRRYWPSFASDWSSTCARSTPRRVFCGTSAAWRIRSRSGGSSGRLSSRSSRRSHGRSPTSPSSRRGRSTPT